MHLRSIMRRPVAAAVMSISIVSPSAGVSASPCWVPPVDAVVVDPFRAPVCRWCPGNRGIEYGTTVGQLVRAVATGRVTYAGVVAGRRYVVVRHAGGIRATYGALVSSDLHQGDTIVRGMTIGRTGSRFHFGLRDGLVYVDPSPYLGHLVHRPRLVPIDGSRPNPGGPPMLRCGR
jgi:murein DD-endopeptidase MepM/ murein hydrolase activator NlpD